MGKGSGRPRSEARRIAILEATAAEVAAAGYAGTTFDAVAARAGSSRQTIYRWWSSKSELVAEAILEGVIPFPHEAIPTTDDLRADLADWLRSADVAFRSPAALTSVLALTSVAAEAGPMSQRVLLEISGRQAEGLAERVRTAVAAGEIDPDIDANVVAESLMGLILYRALSGSAIAEDVDAIVRVLLGRRSDSD